MNSYRELSRLAAARAASSRRARAVCDKLERAWARQRERDAPVESFVARLLDHDQETAEQLLQQASVEYRRRCFEKTGEVTLNNQDTRPPRGLSEEVR